MGHLVKGRECGVRRPSLGPYLDPTIAKVVGPYVSYLVALFIPGNDPWYQERSSVFYLKNIFVEWAAKKY